MIDVTLTSASLCQPYGSTATSIYLFAVWSPCFHHIMMDQEYTVYVLISAAVQAVLQVICKCSPGRYGHPSGAWQCRTRLTDSVISKSSQNITLIEEQEEREEGGCGQGQSAVSVSTEGSRRATLTENAQKGQRWPSPAASTLCELPTTRSAFRLIAR